MFLIQPSVQVMMAARCVFAGPIKRLCPRVSFTQSRSWCSDGPVSDRNEVRLQWLDGEDNGRCIIISCISIYQHVGKIHN